MVEKYLWLDLTTLLAILDKDNNVIQKFIYADSRVPTSMIDANGTLYYFHTDQTDTIKAVSDKNGNLVKTITYDSFGTILSESNPDFTLPFGFAGGLRDSDTKLVRFGYRDYDPNIGKWTAKDPIDFSAGDTNLYAYVGE